MVSLVPWGECLVELPKQPLWILPLHAKEAANSRATAQARLHNLAQELLHEPPRPTPPFDKTCVMTHWLCPVPQWTHWSPPSGGLGPSHLPLRAIQSGHTRRYLRATMAVPSVSTKPGLLPVCVCVCVCVHSSHHITHLHLQLRAIRAPQGCAFHMSLSSGWVRGRRDFARSPGIQLSPSKMSYIKPGSGGFLFFSISLK